MNVFDLRDCVVSDYASYIRSFIDIADPAISQKVDSDLAEGKLIDARTTSFSPAFWILCFDFPSRILASTSTSPLYTRLVKLRCVPITLE